MADSLIDRLYKNGIKNPDAQHSPDVLSCLANLSNDEVFTPPEVVNRMLDMLPQELFSDPNTKFLDPACKTGVFLREIAKRLLIGLEPIYPDLQERIDHIFHNQLYGIAITELTSLLSRRSVYCSQYPNGKYSISYFSSADGNIRYKNISHTWVKHTCVFCGTTEDKFGEAKRKGKELHAYEFIHTRKPEEIFKMKFDVIIGNPPYQLEDGGAGNSARPIYHLFVEQAKKLNPRYLTMIIPSRWFTGGKGLDDFRDSMINDHRIRKLVDYENYKDVFPGLGGLAGGACYFLWDRDNEGTCSVINFKESGKSSSERYMNEFDVFVRQNEAVEIIHKVLKKNTVYLDQRISSRKPFGLPSNYEPKQKGIPCHFIQKIGLRYASPFDVSDSKGYLNKWKFLIPAAPIAGQTDFSKPVRFFYDGNTRIAKPGECCTETWLVAGAFDTEEETVSYKSYIYTKVVRFLLAQTVVSQHISTKSFCFIPELGHYSGIFTDKQLCDMWDITEEEYKYISSRISDVEGE